jgi:hypothetical protein
MRTNADTKQATTNPVRATRNPCERTGTRARQHGTHAGDHRFHAHQQNPAGPTTNPARVSTDPARPKVRARSGRVRDIRGQRPPRRDRRRRAARSRSPRQARRPAGDLAAADRGRRGGLVPVADRAAHRPGRRPAAPRTHRRRSPAGVGLVRRRGVVVDAVARGVGAGSRARGRAVSLPWPGGDLPATAARGEPSGPDPWPGRRGVGDLDRAGSTVDRPSRGGGCCGADAADHGVGLDEPPLALLVPDRWRSMVGARCGLGWTGCWKRCVVVGRAERAGGLSGREGLSGGRRVAVRLGELVRAVGRAVVAGAWWRSRAGGCFVFFAQRTGPGGLIPDSGMITRSSDHWAVVCRGGRSDTTA